MYARKCIGNYVLISGEVPNISRELAYQVKVARLAW